MFHDIEFRIVYHRLPGSIDSDHAVLSPAPGAAPAWWQHHVPVDVSIHTIAQVVMQQGEHVVGVLPRVGAIAALALGLQEPKLWPALMRPLHRSFACPLIPYPRYKGPGARINQDSVRPGVIVRTFDRTSPDLASNASLTKAWAKIIADEVPHFHTCPDANLHRSGRDTGDSHTRWLDQRGHKALESGDLQIALEGPASSSR